MHFFKNALENESGGRVPKQTCSQSAVGGVSTHDAEEKVHTGADWDKISGREISHSSRPSHTPTTNSETWTTLLAYLYDHHIKRSKSFVEALENN